MRNKLAQKWGKASCHDVEEPKQRRGPVIDDIIPDKDPAILTNDPLLPEGESKQTIPEIETGRHPPIRGHTVNMAGTPRVRGTPVEEDPVNDETPTKGASTWRDAPSKQKHLMIGGTCRCPRCMVGVPPEVSPSGEGAESVRVVDGIVCYCKLGLGARLSRET